MDSIAISAKDSLVPSSRNLVSLNPIISVFLFIEIFAGFQGGRYIMSNRLQEVGILLALVVFIIGAWLSLFRLPQNVWKRWVNLPCLLLFGIMIIWAVTFGLNFNESILFSIFSSREFLLGFIGPGIYLIVRSGYPLAQLEKVIWTTLLALLLNYLYFYFTMDLREAFFSTDHTISNLVTYDEWRGFRLKPPMSAVVLSLLGGLMLIGHSQSVLGKLFAFALVTGAVYIWAIVQFRSTLATMLLALVIYWLFLFRPSRLNLIVFLTPIGVILVPILVPLIGNHFLAAEGAGMRVSSYLLALNHIPENLLLGVGEDNSYGRTYQDLFSRTFYPDDIGLIGILFKYGLLGFTLYLYCHSRICILLWRSNYLHRLQFKKHHPLLAAMLIMMIAQTMNLPLIPALAYAQGITTASIAFAFCALVQER